MNNKQTTSYLLWVFLLAWALQAAVIVFARAQNALAKVYQDLYSDELRDYLEHDLKTFEANSCV